MAKLMKKLTFFITAFLLSACQTTPPEELPATLPEEVPSPVYTGTPVVGGIEPAYIIPFKMPFHARMDTGAETSSLDAKNIRPFERDGEKWVSFDIINRKNSEKHHYQKPVKRKTNIVRTGEKERRYVVHMDIKFGKEIINAEFTLNDRDKFDYQVLIGRNIINGRFIIDPSLENTMH